jgi:deoxycytidine triphosphate deaminase
MAPGECLLGSLVERFRMNAVNVVAEVKGKSSWARKFLTIHAAGLIDPGFCGDITLEMKNDGHARIQLFPGDRIAQVSFFFTSAPVTRVYGDQGLNSHYQHQDGPTRFWVATEPIEDHSFVGIVGDLCAYVIPAEGDGWPGTRCARPVEAHA